jgi:hypothetical protein
VTAALGPPAAPVRVLYIAGSVRSGSTVLDKVLGELDGFFAGGEISYVWERGLVENWLCGCGARFRDCPVWSAVLRSAFGGIDAVDARRMIALQRKATRIRYVPRVVLSSRNGGASGADLAPLRENLSRLYSAIRSTTGSRVIVDSSKLPGYGYLLDGVPGIDLRVVHLVRDPRAVAYSWMRKKTQVDRGAEGDMHRSGPFMSSVLWSIWNSTAEALWKPSPERYLLLRYEDFVRDPSAAVRRIQGWLGEEAGDLRFLDGHSVRLGVAHTVAGNPNRLETGRIQIHPDLEWTSRMALRDRALVTGLTWPLLKHYRYPVRAAQGISAVT